MYPERQEVVLFNNVTPVAITSSTSATPIVVTATAHGLSVGQRVLIQGHATNTNANGIFQVIAATSNTFTLGDEVTGASVAGNGTGSNTGICMLAPAVAMLTGYRNATLQIATSGSANCTLKFAASNGIAGNEYVSPRYDYPNMGATDKAANPYSFVEIIPLDTYTALAGGTGLVLTGTDTQENFLVNLTAFKWGTLLVTAWSAGAINAKLFLTTNT